MDGLIRIQVSGDLEGDFVVIEALGEDEFVIARESASVRGAGRPATANEFVAFEAENGPFLPPDGEG